MMVERKTDQVRRGWRGMLIRYFGQVVPLIRNSEPILHVRMVGSSFRLLAAIRSLFAIFVGHLEVWVMGTSYILIGWFYMPVLLATYL